MVFNMNDYVKVKITDFGFKILEEQHQDLLKRIPTYDTPFEEVRPRVDESGWTKMQLWMIMQKFGPYMGMVQEQPIEINITIEEIK